MPTIREMDAAIRNYCSHRRCTDCVIQNDPRHVSGDCVASYALERNYFLILADKKNNKKGNDTMSTNIITDEERKYLLNNMSKLLSEYNYNYTTEALYEIIDTWATNKADLITAFKKHPNYVEGEFMIAFNKNYEREIDINAVSHFSRWLMTCPLIDFRHNLPPEIEAQRQREGCSFLPDDLYRFLDRLFLIAQRTISEETAIKINVMLPNIHAHTGQKTSRIINKICKYLGYDKHPEYNREFAKYADALSPMIIKRHTVLSLNPLDYLTMSFGNSWASCHTIDKKNKRGMPNNYQGCYSSGTISYMLDPSSMVFYTVDASTNGEELWNEPKINRQMFHYGEEKLVQGRLYPQDNDGVQGNELYESYRSIVQEIMSQILEVPNFWTISKGITAAERYICSHGTHYRDYENYNNCTLSRIKGSENDNMFDVGHSPICIECGETHHCQENINCCGEQGMICSDCGYILDEDEAIYVDGDYYCRDCVNYCECCNEYHREAEFYIESENSYVCEHCFEEYYDVCTRCGCHCHVHDLSPDENGNLICEACLSEYYTVCEECGAIVCNENVYEYEGDYLCEQCYLEKEAEEVC